MTWFFVAGAALFVVTNAAVVWIVLRLPHTYLTDRTPAADRPRRHPLVHLAWRLGKNLLGLLLVAVGVVLSLPGVPGQGLLTILIGVMLLDFPGKQRLEHKIIGQPRVLHSVNWLRRKFGRPELEGRGAEC